MYFQGFFQLGYSAFCKKKHVLTNSNPSPAASKRSETHWFQTSFLVSDPLFDPLTVLGLLIDSAPHISFHAVCAVLFHFFRDMAIYIQCKRCRCVAKIRLHSLHIIAILKAEHCIGMAQAMDICFFRADLPCDLFEMRVHRLWAVVIAKLRRKSKPRLLLR